MHLLLWLSVWVCACVAREFDLDADLDMAYGVPPEAPTPESAYAHASDQSLLWGPYRSGHYLGIRPRVAKSLVSGLMWFNADSGAGVQNARHLYEQGHNLGKANWVRFDPRLGGTQRIVDRDCHVDIDIDFVKSAGGRHWAVKVRATPHAGHEAAVTSFVWYSGLESEARDQHRNDVVPQGFLKRNNAFSAAGYRGTVELSGFSKELGLFELRLNDGGPGVRNTHPPPAVPLAHLDPAAARHLSLRVPDEHVWQAGKIFLSLLQDSVQHLAQSEDAAHIPSHQGLLLQDLHRYEGNLHFVQRMYRGACEFDVTFNEARPAADQITFDNIGARIRAVRDQLDAKFAAHFPTDDAAFGHELLSGLLGGLSYSHGDHLVDRETSLEDDDLPVDVAGDVHLPKFQGRSEGPFELTTLVPSRPFFPRGFYWDEGFHLIPLLDYDPDLALEIFRSWIALVDDKGWIAREQILGDEARERVPPAFVVQSSSVVNPPTLMLAFSSLLANAAKRDLQQNVDATSDDFSANLGHVLMDNPAILANYTKALYPKLKLHYDSFRASQIGEVEDFGREGTKELYRWRGRTSTHSLASGLDDYPRVLPMDIAELNVDLLCWVGVMTRSIKSVAEMLQLAEDVEKYTAIEDEVAANIEKFHWSEEENTYCDVSVGDDDEPVHACFKGYISLFPFLTKFVPPQDVAKIGHIVDLIGDPEQLWTDYGIRSLSKSDANYRTSENYWRSPIWINMNYLVLESLAHYHDVSSAYMGPELKSKIAKVYRELRANVISNVKSEWKRTGFVWENYDDMTGEARGAKNFLGWSSLVLVMMKMDEQLH